MEIDAHEIAERETKGVPDSFVSADSLKTFASWKIGRSSDGKLIDLSGGFFRLGSFVEDLPLLRKLRIAPPRARVLLAYDP
jgi:hypothetical protein